MSRFTEAATKATRLRDEGATAPPASISDAVSGGERWTRAMCARHGIDIDELVEEVNQNIETTTINMLPLLDKMGIITTIGAAIAAGYSNGLAVGLEYE